MAVGKHKANGVAIASRSIALQLAVQSRIHHFGLTSTLFLSDQVSILLAMFSNNKIFGLCIAVVALSSGAHAEKQVAETFGLLDASGVDNGVGVPGVASVGVGGPSYVGPGVRPILNRPHRTASHNFVPCGRVGHQEVMQLEVH
ncbi:uncharacterized protein PITG_11596 [Phytophthora infestans T30-4]|uniref:Uncharacterized protein n=1 Tax=Phytophthora infestans (strain T30-4) TaxID=403677 RepID=D0NI46_PHYIT|nr:uncharacterized protein PITG_11596 [Phytophthora infestans T30-4]EEY59131.1 hypothetical protein PITG_11596 [Phytophthora infestans T30-4]|eukprot:XP_002901145.1 hypothetical protein PITG_11596 [Phytophthora infestans T30-4]